MTEIIIEELTNMGLNLQDVRGQGYDNGSNMKGDKAGMQSRIKNLNSQAFYVRCSSHSLNLVVNDMAKASSVAANFFNIIQKLYLFFSSSTFRWAILLKHIKGLTLKPLSATRWESRIEALKTLRFQIGEEYDATKTWYKILNCINPISKLMQTKDFDLASALDLLQNCKKFFKDLRSDKSFNESIIHARKLAAEIDIEATFESTISRHRIQRKKNIFSYESRDEPIEDPKEKYQYSVSQKVCINKLAIYF
ncbi:uncharacterized protein [Onthophagus taurus]|uniref:uncharacterized protein n=1 Tax=Onthophagus taurus TaxID=166361 RepID=UPI0039BDE062